MSRTWSLTPFFNELDVLEIRLAELDPVVDVHVIAEAKRTFSGDVKPLHLAENWDRFEAWHDKIRYIVVDDMPGGREVRSEPGRHAAACDSDRWARENHQRNALGRGLKGLDASDLLFLSDVDEIPSAEHFAAGNHLARAGLIARPRLAMYVYRMRWRWVEALPVIARFFTPETLAGGSLEQVRQHEGTPWGPTYPPSLGWHLAYMGGVEAVRYKLASAAHHELDVPEFNNPAHVEHSIESGADLFDRAHRDATYAPLTELPPYVLANKDRFNALI
jgi:Glycosyltransferase family 17